MRVCVCVCVCVCVRACACVCVLCMYSYWVVWKVMKLCLDIRYVFPDFSFSQDHQRVGRTGETCQNSSICAYAC